MDHYQSSHHILTSGVKRMLEKMERNYPEQANQVVLAHLRETINQFCASRVSTNPDEQSSLLRKHTEVIAAINHVEEMILVVTVDEQLTKGMLRT